MLNFLVLFMISGTWKKITYLVNLWRVKINWRLIEAVFINRNRSAADFLKGTHPPQKVSTR